MEDSYTRLLRAAEELRGLDRVADVARLLDVSLQTMQHWKTRGVPNGKLVEIEEKIGVLPKWITTGQGEMTKPRERLSESNLTKEQREVLELIDRIDEEARSAWIRIGSLLSKIPRDGQKPGNDNKEQEEIRTDTYAGPNRRAELVTAKRLPKQTLKRRSDNE